MSPNTRLPLILSGVAAAMLGAAFMASPLYNTFCRVTGFGGTTQRAAAGPESELDRMVTVEFDANVARGVQVDFKPEQRSQTLHVGATGMAYFKATNTGDAPVSVTATFNVTPFKAGPYFRKLQCFCFTEQTLDPGESVDMPVVYYVDPRMDEDDHLDDVRTITLSYTFFEAEDDTADLAAGPDGRDGREG